MIEVTYEVYRFRKWWKSIYKEHAYILNGPFPTGNIHIKIEDNIIEFLKSRAYSRDLGEIRNLKYKLIKNEK